MSIKEKLINLPGESIFAIAIRLGAKEDLYSCLKMITDQAKDNRRLVMEIIGKDLLNNIEDI
jgi:hypothetical protein